MQHKHGEIKCMQHKHRRWVVHRYDGQMVYRTFRQYAHLLDQCRLCFTLQIDVCRLDQRYYSIVSLSGPSVVLNDCVRYARTAFEQRCALHGVLHKQCFPPCNMHNIQLTRVSDIITPGQRLCTSTNLGRGTGGARDCRR